MDKRLYTRFNNSTEFFSDLSDFIKKYPNFDINTTMCGVKIVSYNTDTGRGVFLDHVDSLRDLVSAFDAYTTSHIV